MRTTRTMRFISVMATAIAAVACSKEPVQQTPLVTPAPTQASAEPPSSTITGSIDAAGIAAGYEATFEGGQLARIDEKRDAGSAEYEFKGARLLRYSGAALHGSGRVELRMDLNGRVVSATAGSGPMSQEQISEITSRAQLLRSHALALAATRNHR